MPILTGFVAIDGEYTYGGGEYAHLFDAQYDPARRVIVYCSSIAHCGERRKNNVPGVWIGAGAIAKKSIYSNIYRFCEHCSYPFCIDYEF